MKPGLGELLFEPLFLAPEADDDSPVAPPEIDLTDGAADQARTRRHHRLYQLLRDVLALLVAL
jgi:hypothetical protein